MAALLGIDVDATISITFVIGAALAAVAGVMFVIYYGVVNFADGFVPGVKAFTAAVLGGIGSLPGRGARRPPDRPHRSVLVVLFHHRLQGRGGVHDPRHHADLHALRHPRPARSGKGLSMTAAPQTTPLAEADATAAVATRSRAAHRDRLGAGRLRPLLSDHQLSRRIEHQQRARSHRAAGRSRSASRRSSSSSSSCARWRAPTGASGSTASARSQPAAWAARWFRPRAKAKASRRRRAPGSRSGAGSARSCSASSSLFPFIMLGLLGPAGSLKWINNYGVQIMIYVMLGWGLNIVVGLAGLLDLGYVAFYAVGAYSYALLSTTFGLSFWICLPLAGLSGRDVGRHSRLPGAAAARRLSRHRDARLRRDHPPRPDQLGRLHQRLRRHLRHPARHAFSAFPSTTKTTASPRSSICPFRRSTARSFSSI